MRALLQSRKEFVVLLFVVERDLNGEGAALSGIFSLASLKLLAPAIGAAAGSQLDLYCAGAG